MRDVLKVTKSRLFPESFRMVTFSKSYYLSANRAFTIYPRFSVGFKVAIQTSSKGGKVFTCPFSHLVSPFTKSFLQVNIL